MSDEKQRAIDLRKKFGLLAELVVDELIYQAHSGYENDLIYELPFFEKVKEELKGV